MSYWILKTHISPSLLIYHRFVKEIKKKNCNILLMAFDLYFGNTNNISQQDYNTSNSKNYCILLIYCYNEVQKLIFEHFIYIYINKTITVFCIGQYELLWTLDINIQLSLKASVNIVFKVHINSYWPQQKTIIV
jgi:hypothetical protein